jgi:hypothetical protein
MERSYRQIEDLSEAIEYSLHYSVGQSHRSALTARLLKTLSSKAEPTNVPEAYQFSPPRPELPRQLFPRMGYVEDAFKARTPLDGVFSSRQNKK